MKRARFVPDNDTLFDQTPLTVGGFELRSRAAVPLKGIRPTLGGWQAALQFASAGEEASPYWVGDLLAYAEDREDWKDKLEQAKTVTKLAAHTLENHTTVARKVKGRARDLAPTPTHSRLVTKLEPDAQEVWLERARVEGWTVEEFNKELRAAARAAVIEGQAPLAGLYRVLYVDPPYTYQDSGATMDGSLGKAERHYPGMTIAQLCALPVEAHALPDSVLFLWVPSPMLYENPGPRELIDAWGFTYKTGIVWDKVLGNWGHYVRVHHEHLLIATRGSCLPDRPLPMPDSVQVVRRSDVHSEKPEAFRTLIEKLYDGPYAELFARRQVEGWTCWGNQILAETLEAAG